MKTEKNVTDKKIFDIETDRNNRGHEVPPGLFGLFFEDINCAADGGINAELIQNNSFEYEYINYNDKGEATDIRYDKFRYWSAEGQGAYTLSDTDGMNKNNPTYLTARVNGTMRFSNCGYPVDGGNYGIETECGGYNFSFYGRNKGFDGEINIYLEDRDGIISDIRAVNAVSGEFEKYTAKLNVNKKTAARLVVEFNGCGTVDADYFSLLPDNVYGNPERWRNGRIKPEFVKILKDLNPKFMRFPGGCIVEGDACFSNMYMWKNTVGELAGRRQNANTWQYLQSYAIGFYEYFLLCEELGAAPLPVVPCGLLCQIRTGIRGEGDRSYERGGREFKENVIENIAHLIYFAKGDINSSDSEESYWANVRAGMGHPEPFNLSMIGIGNENWGEIYFDNLDYTVKALAEYIYKGKKTNLKKQFGIEYVVSAGVDIRPQDTNESWQRISRDYRDSIVDEHVYNTAQWFIDNVHRYDSYDRDNAKVFMGEYGMHTKSDGRGRLNGVSSLRAALSEAAFLTGCERNCDVVRMTCYAPLFAKAEGYRWTPNLIWFNNRHIMRTPSYYVQKLFAENTGTTTLKQKLPDTSNIRGGIFAGAYATSVLIKNIRIKNSSGKEIYSHDFKNGLGEFKLYPKAAGGIITDGGLLLENSGGLNGYYLDKDFGDCTVECGISKISGKEGYIIGLGLSGVTETDGPDNDMFSMWVNYGAFGKVFYEKRFDYMRVAFEEINGKTAGFSQNDKLILSLKNGRLCASIDKDGVTEKLFEKNVYKTEEKLFVSASADERHTYVKIVNVSNEEEEARINISGAGTALVTELYGGNEDVNSIDLYGAAEEKIQPHTYDKNYENVLNITLKSTSLTIIKF